MEELKGLYKCYYGIKLNKQNKIMMTKSLVLFQSLLPGSRASCVPHPPPSSSGRSAYHPLICWPVQCDWPGFAGNADLSCAQISLRACA